MGLITGSWLWDIILFVLFLVSFIIIKIRATFRVFERADVPVMPFWKNFTNNINLLSQKITFIEFMDVVYKEYPNAKAIGFVQFLQSTIMICDPDQIELILKKDFSYFHDHATDTVDLNVNPLEGHLFNMKGAQWRALRNKLSPTFTSGKLKWMLGLMEQMSVELINVLNKQQEGQDILVKDFLSRFAVDVIGSCAFGVDSGALHDPNSEFTRMSRKLFRPNKIQMIKALIRVFVPKYFKIFKVRIFDEEVTNFFFSLTKQAFEHRLKTGEKRGDFLDLLLQLREKGEIKLDEKDTGYNKEEIAFSKLTMTDELLTAQSFIFLAAGWENTATVINFILYFLCKNKRYQDQAREEVKEMMSRHNGHVTYEALRDMVFLDACISESLRIYSPAGGLFRVCNKTYRLQSGGVIDEGTLVMIPIASLQKDPSYFPDPDKFDPYRFLDGNHPQPGIFMPFGDGPRVCIAQRFAITEIKHVLVKLLENFEFELSPRMKEPLRLNPSALVMEFEGGLWVRLKKIPSKKET